MSFSDFFHALWDFPPFPWQTALADKVQSEGKWPTPLGLPTAAGKTAVVDIAIYALAMGWSCAARRIFFVVDRRVVVDEAGERAREIARKIQEAKDGDLLEIKNKLIALGGTEDCPIQTSTLRGGQLLDDAWARSPVQPVICSSTVDQVGSRLLFRGYGCSPGARPIHAALVAYDSLIVLDEVHLSKPFSETLSLIADSARPNRYLDWCDEKLPRPLQAIELSATPDTLPAFVHSSADVASLVLGPRLKNPKPAQLLEVEDTKLIEKIVASASELPPSDNPRVIGIIVNRVKTARTVFQELQKKHRDAEHLLLTGRIRPLDRDAIWAQWRDKIAAKPNRIAPTKTIFLVATQCVEAGANIDFDALVTECASLDALRQRFGRLNRMGNHDSAPAFIVASKKETELADGSAKNPHPVYGSALALTWAWLLHKKENDTVDFAHESLARILPSGDDLRPLLPPHKHAAVLLPAHLDALCQTQPEPTPSPDVHFFLRGPNTELPQVSVLWRELLNDLDPQKPEDWIEAVSLCRPSSMEMMQLPLYAVRAWLSGNKESSGFSDVEGGDDSPQEKEDDKQTPTPCLRWFGEDNSEIITDPQAIRPGDTIVVPAKIGGCDRWGWNPDCKEAVADLSPTVSLALRGYHTLHLSALSDPGQRSHITALFDAEELDTEAIAALFQSLADSSNEPLKATLAWFAANPQKIEEWRTPSDNRLFALRSPIRIPVTANEAESALYSDQDSYRQSKEVKLDDHQKGVANKTASFADLLGLVALKSVLEKGGLLHDCGKADPRFQLLLANGDPVKAATALLAKSAPISPRLREAVRQTSGYPPGTRHEMMSVALLQAAGESDDLLLHLVASHHGHARPLAPIVSDLAPVTVTCRLDGKEVSASSAHGLERIGSGIARRFWLFTRQYGWWGLAYLETILRLADHRQSEEEQQ